MPGISRHFLYPLPFFLTRLRIGFLEQPLFDAGESRQFHRPFFKPDGKGVAIDIYNFTMAKHTVPDFFTGHKSGCILNGIRVLRDGDRLFADPDNF
jgi:hypothetical protein